MIRSYIQEVVQYIKRVSLQDIVICILSFIYCFYKDQTVLLWILLEPW